MSASEATQTVTFRDRILGNRIPRDLELFEDSYELELDPNLMVLSKRPGEKEHIAQIHLKYRGYSLFLVLPDSYPFMQPYLLINPISSHDVLQGIEETPLRGMEGIAEEIHQFLPTRCQPISIKEFVEKNCNRTLVSESEILRFFQESSVYSPALRLHMLVQILKRGVDFVHRVAPNQSSL